MGLNEKTQVITPTYLGELIYEVVHTSMKQLLNPELTASWEKGLTYVAEGSITPDEYMQKLERFVIGRTYNAVHMGNTYGLRHLMRLLCSTRMQRKRRRVREVRRAREI
mgnify:CR=1 FL=1